MSVIHSQLQPFLAIDALLTQLINGQRRAVLTSCPDRVSRLSMHLSTLIRATTLAGLVGCSSGPHGGPPKATDAAPPPVDSGIVSSILCSDGTVRTLREFDDPFSVEPHSGTTGITAAPDGNLYFTEYARSTIGRITPTGLVTEFLLPVPPYDGSTHPFFWPYNIAPAPNGDGVWFTELGLHGIGHLTTAGAFSETAISGTANYGIAVASDGTVWFTEEGGRPWGDPSERRRRRAADTEYGWYPRCRDWA